MEKEKKCSLEEHKEINAIKYCPECRIYICNKCENHHSSLFNNHHAYNINKEEEIFTGFCPEKNHTIKLEFFCKNHNQLCCAACIAKINGKGVGQHKDCEISFIEDIKEEKKNKLKENIKCLEDLQNKFNDSMESLKNIYKNIEKDKDELKLEIQNIFTKIRNVLNNREDELLLEVDNFYNKKYFNEDLIKKGEKLPKEIKISLEKGKLIDKEWDNNNIYSYINDCICIENNIININKIKESIYKCNINNEKFKFGPKGEQLEEFIETIKSFGKIYFNKYSFKECPKDLIERKYNLTGDNKNIITKTGKDGYWMGTICENELDKSIEEHKWKIKILKEKDKHIMIGVATSDFDIYTSDFSTCGFYLFCRLSPPTLYSGPPFNFSGKKTNLSRVNNEIIVVLNMKKRTLKFIINNEDKGDSFTNIPIDKPLFPAVLLYYANNSVEISEV